MGGVRLTDPLEQHILDGSGIEQVSVEDLRTAGPAIFQQLDRLDRSVDRIYVHIDMDVLDPREVMGHGNKVAGGPSSEQLGRLFESIFRRYHKASAIGFATIPEVDEGGLSIAGGDGWATRLPGHPMFELVPIGAAAVHEHWRDDGERRIARTA